MSTPIQLPTTLTTITTSTNTQLLLADRIEALAGLGERLRNELANKEEIEPVLDLSYQHNPWFTPPNQRQAIAALATQLTVPNLQQWVAPYLPLEPTIPRKVAIIMAGNLPLVGFTDVLAVLISGHQAELKLSIQDTILLPWVLAQLALVSPALAARCTTVERVITPDAVIATGSNNTARYFEQYFGKYPNIIRHNRNSVALVTGHESEQDIVGLASDIFSYFGLGCRSVSALLVPDTFRLETLAPAFAPYAYLADHHKYRNNLDYHRAIFLMNLDTFQDMGLILIREYTTLNAPLYSPLAVLNLIRYTTLEQAYDWLALHTNDLQIVVGNAEATPFVSTDSAQPDTKEQLAKSKANLKLVSFGHSQMPTLADYPDGADTLAFLSALA
jgi:hypothetical protein